MAIAAGRLRRAGAGTQQPCGPADARPGRDEPYRRGLRGAGGHLHGPFRLGDLALTCTGDLSRNRQVGLRLGQGESLEHITSSLGMVAEGVKTTSAVYDLAGGWAWRRRMTDTVQGLLHGAESPREAVMRLMTRTLRQE